MYAAIRQGKARPARQKSWRAGSRRGPPPIISDVPGFQAYYVIYAPDVDRTEPGASAYRAGHSGRRTGDCPYFGLYQVPMTATHGGILRRGVDLIQGWRTEEVRHGSANPVEAGLRCDAAA
jgi:hypothetical protein